MKPNIEPRFSQSGVERYPGESDDRTWLEADIAQRPPEDQEIIRRTLTRYDAEGEKNSYQSDPGALLELIEQEKLLEGSGSIVDLGAGPGGLVRGLADRYPETNILGIDLSPNFVGNFNANDKPENAVMRMGLIDSPGTVDRIGPMTEGSVISTLTLDRVADPRQLIDNMGRFKGRKILGTILPIVAEDDDPSRQGEKITYTRPERRIAPGVTEEEDAEAVLELLKASWGEGVRAYQVPYIGESSGDRWEYTLWVFVAD